MPQNLTAETSSLLEKVCNDLINHLDENQIKDPVMVGIHSGGVWVGNELLPRLALKDPLGSLDISFYRDDFSQTGLNPKVKPSSLPFTTENRHVILVDDVIMTGRTIRAAMNELFDYGRPATITLVTLININARQLPIQPDIIGKTMVLSPQERVKLSGPNPLSLEIIKKT